jgi:hypothetical protein
VGQCLGSGHLGSSQLQLLNPVCHLGHHHIAQVGHVLVTELESEQELVQVDFAVEYVAHKWVVAIKLLVHIVY